MELPMIEPAPVVAEHAAVFRDLWDHQCPCRHFQHYLTGLMVLPHKRLATIARGTLESADNTNLSRFLSEAPGPADAVNRRRIRFMLQQTTPHRRRRRESLLALDETLCEHVGSLFDSVDRHDNQRDGTSPLADTPVTSWYVSGAVRFPVGLRRDRRDEELTQWEADVAKPVPDVPLPTAKKARHRRQQPVDPVWLQDPEFQARPEQFRTTMALALALVEEAIRHTVPLGVVVFDAWSLAEDLVQVLARRRTDWISLLNTNRGLQTASVQLREANGWTLKRSGPHIAVEDLVPLIPTTADCPVTVGEHPYGCFTLRVRIPTLGKVRIVVSCARESLTGRRVVLGTNRVDWDAATIIRLYLHRWPTETFDQDSKGPLGCNDYRMRSAEAMGKHGCLVVVASSRLHVTCRPAGPDRTRGLIHTLGDACRQQGRALLQKLLVFAHDQLSHGATIDQLFGLLRTFGERQLMAQRIARRWPISPWINKELRVCHPLLARGNFTSVNPNHQKCARAALWADIRQTAGYGPRMTLCGYAKSQLSRSILIL
jgi:hypothetical protein